MADLSLDTPPSASASQPLASTNGNHGGGGAAPSLSSSGGGSSATGLSPAASAFSASTTPNNPLSRKLTKILNSRLDQDKQAMAALKTLSGFFDENNLRTRRNLRSNIELQSLAIHRDFLASLSKVNDQLELVEREVASMSECCQQMSRRLTAATQKTSQLLQVTNNLNSESERVDLRLKVIAKFLERFQLSQHESAALHSSQPVSEALFAALRRVKEIHADCKVLLHASHQRAGLEIMEQMSLLLESAYEKLYRWTQNECKLLAKDLAEVTPNLRNSFLALSDRPVLFQYCLDELASSRRVAVQRLFIDALTRGGPGGTPKPIEIHSHDPMRYIGDMLAWLHQAAASEKEFLESLLVPARSISVKLAPKPTSKAFVPRSTSEAPLPESEAAALDPLAQKRAEMTKFSQSTLNHIMESCCRPLKARSDQVLLSQPGIVVCFKLTNLLQFYGDTIGALLKPESVLVKVIEELRNLAVKVLLDALSLHARKLLSTADPPGADLTPLPVFASSLSMLREVLSTNESSLAAVESSHQAEFNAMLAQLIDPLLQFPIQAASSLDVTGRSVFILNCLYALQSTLALYESTQQHVQSIDKQIALHTASIVNDATSSILMRTGLASKLTSARSKTENLPLSSVPGMDALSIRSALQQFDRFIASADSIASALSGVERISSPRLQANIHNQVNGLLLAAYETMYDALADPRNGYGSADAIAPRPPHQIKLLLGS